MSYAEIANDDGHGHEEPDYLHAKSGIASWLLTVDHKRIALLYLVSTMTFFLIAGLLAMAFRVELYTAAPDLLTGDQYNKAFTLHGGLMVFTVIVPLTPAVMGNFLLPLMLGAKDVAFPKLNLLSLYCYWFGALQLVAAIVFGNFDTGWTFYTPYSTSIGGGVTWALFGVFALGFSSILTSLNFIVTIHKMRAPGQTWWKVPLFVWATYATAVTALLATPVLAITLLLVAMERLMGIGIFDPARGGDPVLFQHFFWFYSHPAVYIMILPAFGLISDVITVHSRKRIFGYKAIAMSSVAIAVIGFFVWAHHMFVAGTSEIANIVFSFITFFVAVPTAIKVFSWVFTLWQGSIRYPTPMLYALSFIFLFAIGGLTGLFLSTIASDVHLHDTYFVVAHFHYVMASGAVIGFLAGLHHWWPKMFGRKYNENLGRIAAGLIFVGFNWTFFPQFIAGSRGMPRRYHEYAAYFEPLQRMSTIGSFILASGLFLVLFYLLHSLFRGERVPRHSNPWGGVSLEWLTANPPIEHNFHDQPVAEKGPYDFPEIDESMGSSHH